MNSQNISSVGSVYTGHFRESASAPCPDCETRFPLQVMIVELLCKNQLLRNELQEARRRLAQVEGGLFGQGSWV